MSTGRYRNTCGGYIRIGNIIMYSPEVFMLLQEGLRQVLFVGLMRQEDWT